MHHQPLAIPDVIRITPARFGDSRGYFSEVFKDRWFRDNVADVSFVQDNQSEPRRIYRRPQLVRSRVYDKQDDKQIFS